MLTSILTLAAIAAVQTPCLAMAGLPTGMAMLNTTGFNNPVFSPSRGGQGICVSGTIPVTIRATNLQLNYTLPKNQSQITGTLVDLVSVGSTLGQQLVTGLQNITGSYDIGATLCAPTSSANSTSVQFLTHGVAFDRYYWDFARGYSYIDFALSYGQITFSYDRLGVGQSTKADAIREIQTPVEVAIAAELIKKLRDGTIGRKSFTRVVGVGHSFGSIITQGVTNTFPKLLDAAVLTGFSTNTTGQPVFLTANNFAIASQNSPYRFADLSSGYLVSASPLSNQIAFFKSPNFDPQILALADAEKATVTIGEFLSQNVVIKPSSNFTGPVILVNGANDIPFCFGNCLNPSDKSRATLSQLYPRAQNVSNPVFTVPETGHGINLHYSAAQAYRFIQDFVKGLNY